MDSLMKRFLGDAFDYFIGKSSSWSHHL